MSKFMEKMGYEIPEYGIESLPMGGGLSHSCPAYQWLLRQLLITEFTISM